MQTLHSLVAENIIWFLMIPTLIAVVALVKHYFPNYKDDNPIEEAVEEIIEDKTGIKIDLTPGIPDTKPSVSTPVSNETQAK